MNVKKEKFYFDNGEIITVKGPYDAVSAVINTLLEKYNNRKIERSPLKVFVRDASTAPRPYRGEGKVVYIQANDLIYTLRFINTGTDIKPKYYLKSIFYSDYLLRKLAKILKENDYPEFADAVTYYIDNGGLERQWQQLDF